MADVDTPVVKGRDGMDLFRLLANPPLVRVRRQYYPADAVDDYLRQVRAAAEEKQREQADILAQLEERERLLNRREQEWTTRQRQSAMTACQPTGSELVLRASDRASAIVNAAVAQRDRIMDGATQQQARSLAASRAIYYDALQFKQDLARQFRALEQGMDEALDALCGLNAVSPEAPDPADERGTDA